MSHSANTSVPHDNDMITEESIIDKIPSGNIVFEPATDDFIDMLPRSSFPDPMTSSPLAEMNTLQDVRTSDTSALKMAPSVNMPVPPDNDMITEGSIIDKIPSGNIAFEPATDDFIDMLRRSSLPDTTISSRLPEMNTLQDVRTVDTSALEPASFSIHCVPGMNTVTSTAITTPTQRTRTVDVGTQTIEVRTTVNVGTQTMWLFSEAQSKNHGTQTTWSFPDAQALMVKYRELQLMNKRLERKIEELQRIAALTDFETRLKNSDKMCKFYTGLNNAQLTALYNFCDRDEIQYWGSCNSTQEDNVSFGNGNRRVGQQKLTLFQELMLFFLRFRGGLLVDDIAYRFDLKIATVSRVVTSLTQYLYMKFDKLRGHMFPSRDHIREMLPPRFRSMKNIRVILDCAEIFCERPMNFEQQGNCYSEYKAHTTYKVLLGCTPYRAICFVSDLFEGSMSDRAIVQQSGLLDFLEQGDLVLGDRGFTVKDLMDQKGVSLNIPAFLMGRDRLTPQEEVATKEIAANRIFVEHSVKRLKEFRFFRKVVPQNMRHILSQAVFVCACLQNFLDPQIT